MTSNVKKLILGSSLVAAMAMTSGCSTMGMCGSSKCGNDKKGAKSADVKCGGESKCGSASKCGAK